MMKLNTCLQFCHLLFSATRRRWLWPSQLLQCMQQARVYWHGGSIGCGSSSDGSSRPCYMGSKSLRGSLEVQGRCGHITEVTKDDLTRVEPQGGAWMNASHNLGRTESAALERRDGPHWNHLGEWPNVAGRHCPLPFPCLPCSSPLHLLWAWTHPCHQTFSPLKLCHKSLTEDPSACFFPRLTEGSGHTWFLGCRVQVSP